VKSTVKNFSELLAVTIAKFIFWHRVYKKLVLRLMIILKLSKLINDILAKSHSIEGRDFFLSNLVDVYWQLQNLLPVPPMSKLDFYPASTMKVEVAGVWHVGVPLCWAIRCLFSGDIQNIQCAYI
jgi:hypothetical protein